MKKNNFLKIYKNKKALITGSTGFKGSWLSFWLNNLGSNVIGAGLRPEKGAILFKTLKIDKLIKQYYIDITNFKKINDLIKKERPQIIFHLAAQSIVSESYKKPLETIQSNTLGSANILESTRINKIKHLVFITSDKCYLNTEKIGGYSEKDTLGGHDNYSSSKAAAEIIFNSYYQSYFKNKKIKHATARAGNVIGGGDMKKNRVIPDVIKSLHNDTPIILRSPTATRPWQHVLEPLYGYLKLGSYLMRNKLSHLNSPSWNFGPKKSNCIQVVKIVKNIIKEWSKKDLKIKINKQNKFKETNLLSLKIDKAKKELKWQPKLSLKETLKLTVNWYYCYYQKKDMSKLTETQIKYYLKK